MGLPAYPPLFRDNSFRFGRNAQLFKLSLGTEDQALFYFEKLESLS